MIRAATITVAVVVVGLAVALFALNEALAKEERYYQERYW